MAASIAFLAPPQPDDGRDYAQSAAVKLWPNIDPATELLLAEAWAAGYAAGTDLAGEQAEQESEQAFRLGYDRGRADALAGPDADAPTAIRLGVW